MPSRFPGLKKIPLPGGTKITTRMVRDNFKRHKVAEEEVTRTALRYIARNTTLPMKVRAEAQLQLAAMPQYTCETQIKNRCIESGYARSIINDFSLCRMKFRELALDGRLPGVRKASW